MENIQDKRRLLFIHRIHFLKPIEKFYLYQQKISIETMLTWGKYEWERLVKRKLRHTKYALDTLLQKISYDLFWENTGRGWICSILDSDYPNLLRQIPDPPMVLYGLGNREIISTNAVSVVGTRRPDTFGLWAARDLGHSLANISITVVSGLAYGIDAEAHRGALDGDGICIAVLGNSIDYIYPRVHKNLASHILTKKGAIISEIAPMEKSAKYHFIGRNRIISALSMYTVIVQAPEKSGALFTANFALEQNRTLAVHRAGVQDEFIGTRDLWFDGADMWSWSLA